MAIYLTVFQTGVAPGGRAPFPDSTALVGAPRANSSVLMDALYQPGVLFKCEIKNQECQEVVLDKKGNTQTDNRNSDFSFYDKKDGMWLGVSLDVLQNPARNDQNPARNEIVTCGHLWKNQFYKQHYLANGACYVINGDLDPNHVTKLVPFVEKSKQAIIPPGIYKYAFGQVGTSATFSEDGKYLLLGAPGYYDWTGTVVSYALDPSYPLDRQLKNNNVRPAVPSPPTDHNVSPESYIGYSVTSGKFYDDKLDYVAVGAPRDGGFHGRVYIYEAVQGGEKKLIVTQKKEGTQLGEYFGASVLGVNLNGDEYTDLLVGAPLYSSDSGVDEGKVYVFLSNGMGLQEFTELYGKNRFNSRFGTALANLGDLNQDDFNDIAIGAPYEDGSGVVYIYHGSRSGMNVQYVQRIAAVEINSGLSGFGIHISRGFDIDSNQYPDVLVGAYASSNAVLFRTHPVIQLAAKITFSPKQINTNVTNCNYQGQDVPCVNVTACLWYAGKHSPSNLDFQHTIVLEPTNQHNLIQPRGFFLHKGKSLTVIQQKSKLDIGMDFCIMDVLYIRPEIKDVITPIQLLYSYSLVAPDSSLNQFNGTAPVIDPMSPSNITSSVTFQTGCGTDDKCLSDLRVTAVFLGHTDTSYLIIGEKNTLSIAIEIVNVGEPAYLSELLIYLPSELPSINQDICSEYNDQQFQRRNASLICDLGNPLLKNIKVKIQIKLDLTKIPTDKKELEIGLEAITASNEINPKDNIVKIPLHFKALADISITGTPTHEQIPYDGKTEGRISLPIAHTYFVMNHGPSPVQVIDILLYIPTQYQGQDGTVEFITFTSLEADSGKPMTIPAKCNDTYIQFKPIEVDIKKNRDGISMDDELVARGENKTFFGLDYGIDSSELSDDTTVPLRFKRSNDKKTSRKRKDIVINCETAKCMAIQCSASPFSDTRKFAKITVSVLVNLSILNDVLEPWYQIEFITGGEVQIRDDGSGVVARHHHPDKTMVRTAIVSSALRESEEIAQWIIFVSIGVGILLLLIILILLIKFGFFKREQKEKMEKMKSKGDMKEYEPVEGESTESEALN
ncbi:Integrin alpha-9 [Araneus ventricosus]|uniref:Integrin alpha-9 n=1 Tax=Araneus ventricosus TaxID=182803 RepID=A0A4Y2AVG0_ARAVE|nr:Integrin alpha-9 [Araneus ventricosus]GBL83086.1 Integrin alpha-9 [Araneus ventricosus]